MREIKFRAWLNIAVKPHMIHWKAIKNYTFNELENESYTFMQYTGLKDKNGVEIFEGDICQHLYMEDGFKTIRPVKIIFKNGSFCFRTHKGYTFHLTDYALDTFISETEVIGNIYENPDLLTTNTKKEEI